jgi:phosphonate transport system ATP-binding protein
MNIASHRSRVIGGKLSAPMERFVFRLDSVSVLYGQVSALVDVSLDIRPGETVGILGPSGSGKSTLLGVCGGRVRASSGTVFLDGVTVASSPNWQRSHGAKIGFIPQQLHLVDRLRVIHNVNAGLLGQWSSARALRSLVRPIGREEVSTLLERVGIADKIDTRTDQLSGGEQQRVAIARTLRQQPAVMLADEPTASLDPARALDVMQLLCSLAREDKRALIVSQHDVEVARLTCDRLVGLKAGRIAFDLAAKDVSSSRVAALYAA